MQIGILKFGKLYLLASFIIIHAQTFEKFTILLEFKKIDLIFYKFEIVVQKICPINSQTPLS